MKNTKTGFIISQEDLLSWLNKLRKDYALFGPVLKRRGETVFEKLDDAQLLNLDYCTTMASPRRYIYPPRQELAAINRAGNKITPAFPAEDNKIIVGIHPCDMHAVSVLDRTFLGDFKDAYYQRLRKEAVTIVLNCRRACQKAYPSGDSARP
jgi:sulfhydrogenase subunit beta (sulfur reductase)